MIAFPPYNKCLPSKWSNMSNMSITRPSYNTCYMQNTCNTRDTLTKNIPHTAYRTPSMCATYTTHTHQVYIIYSTYILYTQHIEYIWPILHTLNTIIRQNIHYTHNSNICSIVICTTDAYNIYKALTSYTHKTYSRHTYSTHNTLIGAHAIYTECMF